MALITLLAADNEMGDDPHPRARALACPPRPGSRDVHRGARRFPRFVRSAHALHAVRLLIELLADDAAARAAGPTPSGGLAAGGPTTVLRVRRLGGRPDSRALAATAYLAAAAVVVVPSVALAVPWLTELHRLFIA
jgi:hypothetical protein